MIKRLRSCLADGIKIRLDANQAWEFEDAKCFIERVAGIEFEYIEEPLRNPERLEELHGLTGVRYALDETLVTHQALDMWPHAAAMICKPTILGGRQSVERLVKTGKPVVFSAAFESGIGIVRVMQLASSFSPEVPAGLDTLDWLSDDLLLNSPEKRDGLMIVDGIDVEKNSLERIEL